MDVRHLKGHKKIALDTMVFIYYFEDNPQFASKIEKIFKAIESGSIQAATTVITLSEILVKPLELENLDLADEYKNSLNSFPNLEILEINQYLAAEAALLKAKYKIKIPDALQLAGARLSGASVFLTNDHQLKKVEEIEVVTLSQL